MVSVPDMSMSLGFSHGAFASSIQKRTFFRGATGKEKCGVVFVGMKLMSSGAMGLTMPGMLFVSIAGGVVSRNCLLKVSVGRGLFTGDTVVVVMLRPGNFGRMGMGSLSVRPRLLVPMGLHGIRRRGGQGA